MINRVFFLIIYKMPDQTFFDNQTRIDNLIANLIQIQKQTNMVIADQSQLLTQLVSSALNQSTINIVQKTPPQSEMGELLYDVRNEKYFQKLSNQTQAKVYTITPNASFAFTAPYNPEDESITFTDEQENMALTGVQIIGLSAGCPDAAVAVLRNNVTDGGLGIPWSYFRNLNYAGLTTIGLSAPNGMNVSYKLQFPLIFQWKLSDTLRIHFRNGNVANQTFQVILEMVRLKEVM
jgi:hypothetical protein